ncbi:MAG: hypothetical protein UX94_C0008G0003 [Parcubacteria group bacterium GW2011_GWA2_47_21]|nr:MAG: hypothetical protein UX94_C0008G0003 [Parcubacteria group bacterium GW2011_GWA2_47_21]
MRKKVIYIIIFLFLLILAVMAGYYFFFLKKAPAGEADIGGFPTFPGGTLPPLEDGDEISLPVGGDEETTLPRLRQLSSEPTAGAGFVSLGSKAVAVRYIDRATGNAYEADLNSPRKTRLSNNTIPKIYEAVWSADGTKIFLRYLREDNQIETFGATISKTAASTSPKTLTGTYLVRDINWLAVSPENDKIFYLTETAFGSDGIKAEPNGGGRVLLFESPLKEWLIDWPTKDTITVATKPAAGIFGHIYTLNAKTGELRKLVSDIGLTAKLSPDGKKILYSSGGRNSAILKTQALKDGNERTLTATLSDKCVWGKDSIVLLCGIPQGLPSGQYPDSWYQGIVSFNDSVWSFDTDNGIGKEIWSPSAEDGEFDIYEPKISPDGEFLIFINKNDLTLWVLRIK